MVSKVWFRRTRPSKRYLVNFNLAKFVLWRDQHHRLFNLWLIIAVTVIVGATLAWQHPSIAKKLASAGLDDYFKQDVLDEQKDDADRDGLKDAKEAELKTDPGKPDTDGDGLLDGEEVNIYKTNPLAMDTDGDKFSDATEVLTGHDPRRAATTNSSDTAQKTGQVNQGEGAAANLNSVNQLLNGETGTSQLELQDLNANDLSDIASLLGTGNQAAIVVVDSDIKIVAVPDEEARGKVEQYFSQLETLVADIFREELKDPEATQKSLMASLTGGQSAQLDAATTKLEMFTDRAFAVPVPAQIKEFHKLFLKIALETSALGKGLQRMDSDSADSLLVLSQFDQLQQDAQTAQTEFNKISTQYELGALLPALIPTKSQ